MGEKQQIEGGVWWKTFQDSLSHHGYSGARFLGEGLTRLVYQVMPSNASDLDQKYIAKVEKPPGHCTAPHHNHLRMKGPMFENEFETLRSINHPNVVQIHDFFPSDDDNGCDITIEEYFDAISLDELIKIQGPITNHKKFVMIFSQVIDALHHLHTEKGIIHRDISAKNILVGRTSDTVKLTDFQYAAPSENIDTNFFPTRGSTPYTHPFLLEAPLVDETRHASVLTDLYALGVVMHYASRGSLPFPYQLVEDPTGVPVKIGDLDTNLLLQLSNPNEQKDGNPLIRTEKMNDTLIKSHNSICDQFLSDSEWSSKNLGQLVRNVLSITRYDHSSSPEEIYQEVMEDFADLRPVAKGKSRINIVEKGSFLINFAAKLDQQLKNGLILLAPVDPPQFEDSFDNACSWLIHFKEPSTDFPFFRQGYMDACDYLGTHILKYGRRTREKKQVEYNWDAGNPTVFTQGIERYSLVIGEWSFEVRDHYTEEIPKLGYSSSLEEFVRTLRVSDSSGNYFDALKILSHRKLSYPNELAVLKAPNEGRWNYIPKTSGVDLSDVDFIPSLLR